jgi:uncharacterized peroxidase-related enzyme
MAIRAGGSVELMQQVKANYRRAPISAKEMAMLEFAELLTVEPSNVLEEDVQRLRAAGWRDEDIVDIVHQTALFAYMTRVADGLGIEVEEYMRLAEERDRDAIDTSRWGHWGDAAGREAR